MTTTDEHQQGAMTGKVPGWLIVVGVAVVIAWPVFQIGWLPGHVLGATRFILGDQGSYLYAIGRWQAGEGLYRDFAWQYGPLALGWYRLWAAIGGNSAVTLVVASSITYAMAWVLVAGLVVRLAGWRWGCLLAVVGSLPVMTDLIAYAMNGAHGAVEMLLLAGCAWTLAADEAARWRPWLLGVLAGLLHWVRFGPQVPALIAIGVIIAWQRWPKTTQLQQWARQMVSFAWRLSAAYALTVTPLVIWIVAALPAAGARDQLWPSYMVAHYAATYAHRWPEIPSFTALVVIWLPPLLGVSLMAVRFIAGGGRNEPRTASPRSGAVAGLLFFPLYYVICFAVIFRTDNLIVGGLWFAWPGLALVVGVKSRLWRVVIGLLVVPSALFNLVVHRALFREEQAWRAQPVTMPNGQQLWFHGEEARRFGDLQTALGPAPQSRRMAVMLSGGGIHHFFGVQRMGRHWWFLPGFVRPWEEKSVEQALLRDEMILVADRDEMSRVMGRPGSLTLGLPLPKTMSGQLLPRLRNPRHLEGIGVLFDVQP